MESTYGTAGSFSNFVASFWHAQGCTYAEIAKMLCLLNEAKKQLEEEKDS